MDLNQSARSPRGRQIKLCAPLGLALRSVHVIDCLQPGTFATLMHETHVLWGVGRGPGGSCDLWLLTVHLSLNADLKSQLLPPSMEEIYNTHTTVPGVQESKTQIITATAGFVVTLSAAVNI